MISFIARAATGLVAVVLGLLLIRYFMQKLFPPERLAVSAGAPDWRRLAFIFIITRAGLYLAGLALYAARGMTAEYLRGGADIWVRWDADHYLSLAKNWYVNEGDARFHIVFYPLYPLLVRSLAPLCFGNYTAAGFLASNGCLFGAMTLLFYLTRAEADEACAYRAVRYLCLNPLSLFLSVPYGESLFLLLTLAAVYAARRRRFALAILMGALCAATRTPGILVAIPVYYEMLAAHRRDGFAVKARCALATCLIGLGLAAYLLLNYAVTGDALRFLTYQKEHWYQQFGSLANTLTYTLENAISYHSMDNRLGTWIPQIVSMGLFLLLMCRSALRQRAGDAAYFLVYYYVTLSPTWLLSGARYLFALYAVYPLMAREADTRPKDIAVSAALAAGSVYGVWTYAVLGTML